MSSDVCLVTTWNERCGIAEYAKNLVAHSGSLFNIVPTSTSLGTLSQVPQRKIHFNYEPGLFRHISAKDIWLLKGSGKIVSMTYHTSHDGMMQTDFTDAFDKVVVHENWDNQAPNFVGIPHGILDVNLTGVDIDTTPVLGTVGFPFPWKGFELVVQVAKRLNMRARVIAPDSPHWNTFQVRDYLETLYPGKIEYITDWLSQEDTIKELAKCTVVAFLYQGGNAGISGACRMGISSHRPIVLSSCRQFNDLRPYVPEVSFCGSIDIEVLAISVMDALSTHRPPQRLMNDMSWQRVAKMYDDLFSGVN